MDPRVATGLLYFCSSSAQVWSALMVFHILLVRDLRAHVESEIQSLWNDTKHWWSSLLLSLLSPGNLREKLPLFGLTSDVVLRADTHKNSFIRLVAAIKTHRIVAEHFDATQVSGSLDLTPQEWQLKFDPIADRILELEARQPGMGVAFRLGITGIAVNLTACAAAGWVSGGAGERFLAGLLVFNLVLLTLFIVEVRQALAHVSATGHHEAIAEHLEEFERTRRQRWPRIRRHPQASSRGPH